MGSLSSGAGAGVGWPLERERELSHLERLLALSAEQGRLLIIEGPAGIGKSTLLREARTLAREAGIEVLHARGNELERAYPFGVASSLLQAALKGIADGDRERLLRGRAALADRVLGPGEAHGALLASPTDEFGLIHGLYWAVVNLTEERPLAILVDDVHWTDEPSLRFLLYLAQRLEDLPLTMVVTIRSGDPTVRSELVARLTTLASEPVLRPTELSQDAVGRLLAASDIALGDQDGLLREAWRATRGNPFLVTELLAALRQDPAVSSRLAAPGVDALAPESVGRMTMVRLARLGGDALALARACAVLGDDSATATAATLAGLDPADAAPAAECLVDAQILDADDRLSFAHPMIRSAIYTELPVGERHRLHLDAARLLDLRGHGPVELARHLLSGSACAEPWALRALHEAAREAGRVGSPQTAVGYLTRALDLDPDPERKGAMLLDLGLAEAAAGQTTSLERFEAALAVIDDTPPEKARAIYALGQTLYRYGRHAEAHETFRRGALLLGFDRDLALTFEAARMCSAIHLLSDQAEAMRELEAMVQEIPSSRPPNSAEGMLLAVHSVYRATTTPATDATADLASRALADGNLLSEQTSESMAVNLAILALLYCSRLDEAEAAVDEVLADARARGSVLAFAEGSLIRAMVMLIRGRINDAEVDARAAIQGMERGWHAMVPWPQSILARCLIEQGELGEAEAVLTDVEPHIPDQQAVGIRTTYYAARGMLHLAQGNPADALEILSKAGEILAVYRVRSPIPVPWRTPAALAAHALGDDDRARLLLEEELQAAQDFALPAAIGSALRARAVIGGADVAELEAVVATLEEADAPLELARALFDLGSALRRAGRRTDARTSLRRALDLAHRSGATALERRTRDEILASGGKPRRALLTGVGALTPSERRIADLVADGHSNRDVAETLFLSKGTVEWHLVHVYQKLDIQSRSELPAMLAEHRDEPSRIDDV